MLAIYVLACLLPACCPFACLPACLLSACLHICLPATTCLFTCVSVCLACLSACLSICLLAVWLLSLLLLSTCVSVCPLAIYLHVCLSLCVPASLKYACSHLFVTIIYFMTLTSSLLCVPRPTRVLFYEYFNPRSIYFLIGWIKQRKLEKYFEISIISSAGSTQQIKHVLDACLVDHSDLLVKVLTNLPASSAGGSPVFDYIEYTGGISLTLDSTAELRKLSKVSFKYKYYYLSYLF
jgi:hypothetical protein